MKAGPERRGGIVTPEGGVSRWVAADPGHAGTPLQHGCVWACTEPESPAHVGTCWLDACAACRLAYAVAAADGRAFLPHQRIGQFMAATELAERFDDDRMRRILASA